MIPAMYAVVQGFRLRRQRRFELAQHPEDDLENAKTLVA
jgi:hypothetical protein